MSFALATKIAPTFLRRHIRLNVPLTPHYCDVARAESRGCSFLLSKQESLVGYYPRQTLRFSYRQVQSCDRVLTLTNIQGSCEH
jgi:hypothetical protein